MSKNTAGTIGLEPELVGIDELRKLPMHVDVEDFLASRFIARLSAAEVGAYMHLLCYAWEDPDCNLPDDDESLARLARLDEATWSQGSGAKIRACFEKDPERPGTIFNRKQRSVRRGQQFRINRSRKAMAVRWSGKRRGDRTDQELVQA